MAEKAYKEAAVKYPNDVKLAFRQSESHVVDTDKKAIKKLEMQSFVETYRQEENTETFKFLSEIDSEAAPSNIKMLYLYKEGSVAQYKAI